MNEELIREQVCGICRRLCAKGWTAANSGSVSVRLDGGEYLITP